MLETRNLTKIYKPKKGVPVKAVDNVETLFVPRSAFMKLANQAPDLAAKVADRIRQELMGYLGEIERVGAPCRRPIN